MKTTIKKSFLDIQKEEDWLNEQGENGQLLIGYHSGVYEFEDVSPAKYQYKIDLPDYSGSKKKDYLAFLEQCGVSIAAQYSGRIYLRKNKADGPLDIYTGKEEISKQMSKRYTHFFIIGVSQFILGSYMLFHMLHEVQTRGVPLWIAVIIDAGLMISGIIFFINGIRKWRKYSPGKEDAGLWE